MIFKLTAKGCQISAKAYQHITQHLIKITQALPDVEEDLLVFRLTIKKNIDKYYPPKTHPHLHKTYADTKPELAYFEGSINFRLNKKRFFVHFKGQTVDECINTGFNRIFKELEKFKDTRYGRN